MRFDSKCKTVESIDCYANTHFQNNMSGIRIVNLHLNKLYQQCLFVYKPVQQVLLLQSCVGKRLFGPK